jgi:hypothetical protein
VNGKAHLVETLEHPVEPLRFARMPFNEEVPDPLPTLVTERREDVPLCAFAIELHDIHARVSLLVEVPLEPDALDLVPLGVGLHRKRRKIALLRNAQNVLAVIRRDGRVNHLDPVRQAIPGHIQT